MRPCLSPARVPSALAASARRHATLARPHPASVARTVGFGTKCLTAAARAVSLAATAHAAGLELPGADRRTYVVDLKFATAFCQHYRMCKKCIRHFPGVCGCVT